LVGEETALSEKYVSRGTAVDPGSYAHFRIYKYRHRAVSRDLHNGELRLLDMAPVTIGVKKLKS